MPDDNTGKDETRRDSTGLLQELQERVSGYADALKQGAAAAWKEKAAEIREAIGPNRAEPVKDPERSFGREQGGDDVKRVVWTGHAVQTNEGRRYFGAVGLTESGYYRAAEVQVYGADEAWRWEAGRHTGKEDAVRSAQTFSEGRLHEHDRLMQRSAAHAARDVLHDASSAFKPGAYTVQEARDRAAHTPSVLGKADAPRTREEEWQLVREVSVMPGAKETVMERIAHAYEEMRTANPSLATEQPQAKYFQAEQSAAKTIKETIKNVTPEQQENVNKMLNQTTISREQIGGATDVAQGGNPLPTPRMPEPPQGSPQQGRTPEK